MNYQLHNKSLPFYFPATLKNKKKQFTKKKKKIQLVTHINRKEKSCLRTEQFFKKILQ